MPFITICNCAFGRAVAGGQGCDSLIRREQARQRTLRSIQCPKTWHGTHPPARLGHIRSALEKGKSGPHAYLVPFRSLAGEVYDHFHDLPEPRITASASRDRLVQDLDKALKGELRACHDGGQGLVSEKDERYRHSGNRNPSWRTLPGW